MTLIAIITAQNTTPGVWIIWIKCCMTMIMTVTPLSPQAESEGRVSRNEVEKLRNLVNSRKHQVEDYKGQYASQLLKTNKCQVIKRVCQSFIQIVKYLFPFLVFVFDSLDSVSTFGVLTVSSCKFLLVQICHHARSIDVCRNVLQPDVM